MISCTRCGYQIEFFKGLWWSGHEFMCPDREEQHTAKGLRVEIIKSRYYSPSGNHTSPSEHVTEATLIATDGRPLPKGARVCEPTESAPALVIEHNIGEHMRARFASQKGWVMASGAWVHSGDSRFREIVGTSYPIPLHDRQENY